LGKRRLQTGVRILRRSALKSVRRMTRPRRAAAVLGVSMLVTALGVESAWAPGSLSLQDLVIAMTDEPQLVAEINAELKNSGLEAGKVICWAGRHGNHWKYLAGKRSAPYACTFGKRTLTVEAEVTYYDEKERALGDAGKADPRRARTFRETKIRWTWSP
jgi:hypothetical protein